MVTLLWVIWGSHFGSFLTVKIKTASNNVTLNHSRWAHCSFLALLLLWWSVMLLERTKTWNDLWPYFIVLAYLPSRILYMCNPSVLSYLWRFCWNVVMYGCFLKKKNKKKYWNIFLIPVLRHINIFYTRFLVSTVLLVVPRMYCKVCRLAGC